ncbi:MAG: hypothetical protein CMN76_02885 [Spirochaetaceae bacterium]|nr:hypothetical protein [Spirochaetaceae bacterium]|tara:strand:+ start:8330 stop:9337 length:1008 start_codon:yes stop_codon:yes gene_type:complete
MKKDRHPGLLLTFALILTCVSGPLTAESGQSLYLDYLELPEFGHLERSPYSNSRAEIFELDSETYLIYRNVGFDFPDPDDLIKEIKKNPGLTLYSEAEPPQKIEKRKGQHLPYYLLEGKDKAGRPYLAAVVNNRRFMGIDKPGPTAGVLFLVGPSLKTHREGFLAALEHYRVHDKNPLPRKREIFGSGGYSLQVPVSFFRSYDASGIRLTSPDGDFIIMDYHLVDGDVVLAADKEKWIKRIEKGYYSYLFARGDQKFEKAETVELENLSAIRLQASAMLPGPYGIISSSRYYIFSTRVGIGILIFVGSVDDAPTLDEIINSLRIEKGQAPLGLGR